MNTVADNVAKATDTSAQATTQTVAAAMRTEATKSTADPAKTAADFAAKAAEQEANYQPTLASVKQAAQTAAAVVDTSAPITRAKLSVGGLDLIAANQGSWGANLQGIMDTNHLSKDVADAIGVPLTQLFNITVTDTSTGRRAERFSTVIPPDYTPPHFQTLAS